MVYQKSFIKFNHTYTHRKRESQTLVCLFDRLFASCSLGKITPTKTDNQFIPFFDAPTKQQSTHKKKIPFFSNFICLKKQTNLSLFVSKPLQKINKKNNQQTNPTKKTHTREQKKSKYVLKILNKYWHSSFCSLYLIDCK